MCPDDVDYNILKMVELSSRTNYSSKCFLKNTGTYSSHQSSYSGLTMLCVALCSTSGNSKFDFDFRFRPEWRVSADAFWI